MRGVFLLLGSLWTGYSREQWVAGLAPCASDGDHPTSLGAPCLVLGRDGIAGHRGGRCGQDALQKHTRSVACER